MLRKKDIFIISLSFLCFILSLTVNAQNVSEEIIKIQRIDNLDFDGKLDEAFWKDLTPFDFIQFQPNYSVTISEKLNVYMIH